MKDLAHRFPENPLLVPSDIHPSRPGMEVICLLNPGVFRFEGKIWLLLRVAENLSPREGSVLFPTFDAAGEVAIQEVFLPDPDLDTTDPRVMRYKGLDYLTTLSHLRLVYSENGVDFIETTDFPSIMPKGENERFGIEDARVSLIGDEYFIAYTAVSSNGVGVGLRSTRDWRSFDRHGMILPPHNKDAAIFEETINGRYYMLHRPSSVAIGGNFIWLAESTDGLHWGNHRCLIRTRHGYWDSARVGAGAAPIKTEKGWLEIYHGATAEHRYCLGAFLLDLRDPARVIARSETPIMEPTEPYELSGFFGHVVFTNGHIVDGDELTIYYGAADEFVCGARFSIAEILDSLLPVT